MYTHLDLYTVASILYVVHCVGGLLTEVKAKRKEENRAVEAKEAFSSLDTNHDDV